MNNVLKGSLIAAMLLVVGGGAEQAYAQRCGGDLSYTVRNKQGEIIDADKVELGYIRSFVSDGAEPLIDYGHPWNYVTRDDSMKMLTVETRCGQYLVEVALKYEGRAMLLRFHNIPPELNFFVDSVPFGEGIYEIDFKSRTATTLRGVTLNREGLRSKGEKYLLRSIAQLGLLVSSENWRRTSSK